MKITYFKLLAKVYKSIPPKKVKVGTATYTWNGCDYILNTDSRRSLSDTLTSWTTKAQTTAEFIEVVEEFLTEEEKEYLSTVIEPFRGVVNYISKQEMREYQYLFLKYTDVYCTQTIVFPMFEKGRLYKGMELNKKYTLEELGL